MRQVRTTESENVSKEGACPPAKTTQTSTEFRLNSNEMPGQVTLDRAFTEITKICDLMRVSEDEEPVTRESGSKQPVAQTFNPPVEEIVLPKEGPTSHLFVLFTKKKIFVGGRGDIDLDPTIERVRKQLKKLKLALLLLLTLLIGYYLPSISETLINAIIMIIRRI